MSVPNIPPAFGMLLFGLLVLLLVQKEVQRAMGRAGPHRWRIASNWLIGLLLVSYGSVLIMRFLSLF